MEVTLPDNVKVVIETGGSAQWNNDFVDAEKLQRFVYAWKRAGAGRRTAVRQYGRSTDAGGFSLLLPENYPAEKRPLCSGITAADLWRAPPLTSFTAAIR